ncbi:bifunctional hydroxymethylpyrimidine kinase/phosphomethylpyrimidine kinase [Plebeiibacterium marinum]|uniref:hydroxymethylpyrimidine kinase n=1 Tax=Plebeiibacterium marinum TaxID=2992111 RepID=A0AAE3MBF6_9BACT|nr:bifunctional hydroxymethylpyrimidine kinase/phosphomethylpyrimidine kinase [Plebeiobacterium marinum]MCW3804643.1 bifunctional hydroxymethylpyrimidine kinase/phosphomethylpyrimidine kinase [Plebeiobacterium marinum]
MKTYNRVLTIAGSDSGGGAGVQADIKTISACGCYATSVITAITAQNTIGVTEVFPIPAPTVKNQMTAVLEDIGTDIVKIGMLHNSETIVSVHQILTQFQISNIVLDPVMVSTSGKTLLKQDAIITLKETLIPAVKVITPNIPEVELLLNKKASSQNDLPKLAKELGDQYHISVLLKAGHAIGDELTDILYNFDKGEFTYLKSNRIKSKNTHGTGCTLSSALASFLAKGLILEEAASLAKKYMQKAILAGADYKIGKGHGPVKHFYDLWD